MSLALVPQTTAVSSAPPGLARSQTNHPRLAPWAAFFRRFAAGCDARFPAEVTRFLRAVGTPTHGYVKIPTLSHKPRQGWGTRFLRFLVLSFQGSLQGVVQGGFCFLVFLLGDAALFVLDFQFEEFFF